MENVMEYEIRHAVPDDLEAVHQIMLSQSVIDGTMRLPNQSIEATRNRVEVRTGFHRLVALKDKELVGFIELETYPLHPRHRHAGDINFIAIHEGHQGKGVGRTLMNAIIDLADNWLNLKRLSLEVWTTNQPAIRLYENCGFSIEGTHPAYVFTNGVYGDAYSMGRVLDRE
jgi:putative acetyltransferase